MPSTTKSTPTAPASPTPIATHGSADLPSVTVETYNAELRDSEGFIGDRASQGAFRELLEGWRERLRRSGHDPLGEESSDEIAKPALDEILASGDLEQVGVIQGAMEDFAQDFAGVIRKFLRLKAWRETKRIVIGGGFRGSRVGEIVIGRTAVLLKAEGIDIDLVPIRNHPDEAGLIGAVHLAPAWIFSGHDSILAVDIGGTKIRAGLIELGLRKGKELPEAQVRESEVWRHRDENPKRGEAIERLNEMLRDLVSRAGKAKLKLAPFIGIGCPGLVEEDGSIDRGGQNLPGNWESSRFNLPQEIFEGVPEIGGYQTMIVMHNDAVVQGLSEVPFMKDVPKWGVLTIGTGLGNACFTNKG